MNEYDIAKALGDADPAFVAASAPGKKKKRRRWIPAVAAVLAVALGLGGFGVLRNRVSPHPLDPSTEPESGTAALPTAPVTAPAGEGDGVDRAQALQALAPFTAAAAVYPATAPYPDENATPEMRSAWDAARQERYSHFGAGKNLSAFYARLLPAALGTAEKENAVCSPLNLYFALAMLAEITDGASRAQVLELLGAEDAEALRRQCRDLWLAHYADDGLSTLLLANSVWLREGAPYREDALRTLTEDLFASAFRGVMGSAAYDGALRAWVNANTGGLLTDLAGGLSMNTDTMIALASAVYFRARWGTLFDAAANTEDVFRGTDGDRTAVFMHLTEDYAPCWYGDAFSAVELPLTEQGSMLFLLPEEGVSPAALFSDPAALAFIEDPAAYGEDPARVRHVKLRLSVPKFDVGAQTELSACLQTLGVTDCFDPMVSDFSPLAERDDLFVSAVRHGARVQVDENGVEAAAYTVISVAATALPPQVEELDFTLDRPFVFVIRSADGQPLFAGVVNRI